MTTIEMDHKSEAMERIDLAINECAKRSLMDADAVINMLLDIRIHVDPLVNWVERPMDSLST